VNAVVATAQAQFRQQWKLVLLPLAGGLIAATLHSLGKSGPPPWVTQIAGAFAALTLAPTVAVLLGLNLLGPELRQRRLSFYLSRPCAPWKLWAGRLAAALAILLVSLMGATLALPILAEAPGLDPLSTAAGVAIMSVTLLLVTNALTSLLLAFSWDALLVDLVAMGLMVASVSALFRSVFDLFAAPGAALQMLPVIFCCAIVALVPAGLAFLLGGRGRPRWGHRWFSWTFWPLVALSVLGLNGWRILEMKTPLSSVLRTDAFARPLDSERFLIHLWGKRTSDGGFVVSSTGTRSFVVNVQSGAATRVSASVGTGVVSPDGDHSAWSQLRTVFSRDFQRDLVVARTAALDQPLYRVEVPCCIADLSVGGERALIRTNSGLQIIDVASGTLHREILFEKADYATVRFGAERSVEATIWAKSEFRRVAFNLDGTVRSEWRIPRPVTSSLLFHEATGRYAIGERERITFYDRDGKAVHTLPGLRPSGYFTRTGALVVTTRDMTILPPDGSAPRTVTLKRKPASSPKEADLFGFRVMVAGELDSGELVVRVLEDGGQRSFLVDPDTAAVRLTLEGVQPFFRGREPGRRSPALDTILRVFQNEDGDLLYLDRGATKLRLLVKSTAGDF
jgi:hypothetical protein